MRITGPKLNYFYTAMDCMLFSIKYKDTYVKGLAEGVPLFLSHPITIWRSRLVLALIKPVFNTHRKISSECSQFYDTRPNLSITITMQGLRSTPIHRDLNLHHDRMLVDLRPAAVFSHHRGRAAVPHIPLSGCHRTSQVIRPTYRCPCPKDLR
jgi:hypothetical protein